MDEPRDGIWLFDVMVFLGFLALGVCAMVGVCVIVLSLA